MTAKYYIAASDDLDIHDCLDDAIAKRDLLKVLAYAEKTGKVVYELVRVNRPAELSHRR